MRSWFALLASFTVIPVSPADEPTRAPAAPLTPAEEAKRDALARYGVGHWRALQERPVDAVKQLQAAADDDPKAVAPQRELVQKYYELGRYPAAVRAAEAVLKLDPADADTARTLGTIHSEGKRYADAVKAFRLAADSPRLADRPMVRLNALRELAAAADSASDPASAETARRDALALTADRGKQLVSERFTALDLARLQANLNEDLGAALVKRKKYAEASEAFVAARDLFADPAGANDPAAAHRVHWNLSGSLMEQGEHEKALAELLVFLAKKPSGFAPYERFAELYAKLNRADDLPAALDALARANPKNPAPRVLAAVALARTDFPAADRALRGFAAAVESPDAARAVVRAYRADRPKELLDLADEVFRKSRPPEDDDDRPKPGQPPKPAPVPPPQKAVEAARHLAAALREQPPEFAKRLVGQLATDLKFGTARAPDTLELVAGFARKHGVQNELIGAISSAARGTGKPAERATLLLFSLLREQRRWKELVDAAKAAKGTEAFRLKLSPDYAMAEAYAELGDEKQALDRVEYVMTNVVADGRLSARLEKARLLTILGKPADAIKECDATEAEFRTPKAKRQAAVVRADALNRLGKQADAEGVLRDLLDDDPDDVLVLNNLGYNLADQGRKLAEAETLIRRAIDLDRDARARAGDPEAESGGYLDSLGWVLFRRGKLKDARDLLEKAAASPAASADAIVWDHLGDVRFRLGDPKRAGEAWRTAAELYTDTHAGRHDGRLAEVKKKIELVK